MLPLLLMERLLLCCISGGEVGAPALQREFVRICVHHKLQWVVQWCVGVYQWVVVGARSYFPKLKRYDVFLCKGIGSRPKNITISLSGLEGVMVRCLTVGGWSEWIGCMAIPGSNQGYMFLVFQFLHTINSEQFELENDFLPIQGN